MIMQYPFILIFVAHPVNYITVESSAALGIPKSLIIPSCNLELGRTIGQGNNTCKQICGITVTTRVQVNLE